MRRPLGICIALLLALPAAAAAQDQDERAFGPVVAASGDARLRADETDERVCVAVQRLRSTASACGEGAVDVRRPVVATTMGAAGGAVDRAVARVEVQWRDGTRTAADTVAPRETGPRFFVVARGGTQAWLVRHLAADGRLLRVTQENDGPVVGKRMVLARGRIPKLGRWTATAWLERSLAPAPGQPDRTELLPCVRTALGGGRHWQCASGEPQLRSLFDGAMRTLQSWSAEQRKPQRHLLLGVLGGDAAGVTLELGDGRRVRARVRTLSGGGASVPVVAYAVPHRAAVRRLVVRDRSGGVLETHTLGFPPASLRGLGRGLFESERPPLPGTAEVAAGPVRDGEGVLRVREVGAYLCGEVDVTYDEAVCGRLPEVPAESLLVGGVSAHHGVVAGVVPPEVASVVLEETSAFAAPGPATVRIDTQAPSPYAGAFAPHVRTFAGLLPVGGFVRVRLLDAAGKDLFETSVDASRLVDSRVGRTRTLLRDGRLRVLRDREHDDCLFVNDPLAKLVLQNCPFGGSVDVLVVCRPAASVVILPGGRGTLVTAGGRRMTSRAVRLGGRAQHLFVVHAPDVPRTARWRGGSMHLGPLASPREQCGYELSRPLK